MKIFLSCLSGKCYFLLSQQCFHLLEIRICDHLSQCSETQSKFSEYNRQYKKMTRKLNFKAQARCLLRMALLKRIIHFTVKVSFLIIYYPYIHRFYKTLCYVAFCILLTHIEIQVTYKQNFSTPSTTFEIIMCSYSQNCCYYKFSRKKRCLIHFMPLVFFYTP